MAVATNRLLHSSVGRTLAVFLVVLQALAIAFACSCFTPACADCPCCDGAQCEDATVSTKCPTAHVITAQATRSEVMGNAVVHLVAAVLPLVIAIPVGRATALPHQRQRWRHRLQAYIELGRMLR